MSKGSGGARTATAPKAGSANKKSDGSYNAMTGEGMEKVVTEDNLKEMQSLMEKGGFRVLATDRSSEYMDEADVVGYKLKPGAILVSKSDPRSGYEAQLDIRPLRDFAPVNKSAKAEGYKEEPGTGKRKAIEPTRAKFNEEYARANRLRDTANEFERAGAKKQAEKTREKMRESRRELLRLGKKIADFEHNAGRVADGNYMKGFRQFL